MGRTIDEVMSHAMAAAGDWAQGARVPRPRSLAAVCDDPDVQRALAGGAVLAVVPLVFDSD